MENQMTYGGIGGWGLLIVLILFIWMVVGGGGGFFNRGFNNAGGVEALGLAEILAMNNATRNSNNSCQSWEVMRQELVDTATTQYKIEDNARQTQDVVTAGIASLGNKIDFYEYQNLRDELAAERSKNMALESKIYSETKFGIIEQQIERLASRMLKQPEMSGIVAVCPDSAVYRGTSCGC